MAPADFKKMPHESDVEWGLRRKFLLAHEDKFENTNRLLCLASCFINVEMYGCRYPNPVMIELKDLITEISDDVEKFRRDMRLRTEVQFVKGSEDDGKSAGKATTYGNFVKSGDSSVKSSSSPDASRSSSSTSLPIPQQATAAKQKPDLMAGFVKSDEAFVSTSKSDGGTRISPELQSLRSKFYTLAGHLREIRSKRNPQANNSVSALHMAVDKARMTISTVISETEDGFVCNLQIDGVDVAASSASKQKKLGKSDAYDKAVTSLTKPYMQVKSVGLSERELHASDFPFDDDPGSGMTKLGQTTRSNIRPLAGIQHGRGGGMHEGRGRGRGQRQGMKRRHNETIYDSFYILHPKVGNHAASGILHQSSEFSKKLLQWDFQGAQGGGVQCTVLLENTVVGQDTGETKQIAKKAAAEVALEHLRGNCWTFLIKQSADSEEAGISRTEILGDDAKNSEALPDSNIGSKMMKMMGWSGGGIGKSEQGIKEPINVNTVINREGLGMMADKGISKNFIPQIKSTIQKYARSDNEGDLVFASDITKEERALIHTECKKLNLKSHSHGSGEDRFLVVSRKRSVDQLFAMLQRQGGESSKYLLVAPGEPIPTNAPAVTPMAEESSQQMPSFSM